MAYLNDFMTRLDLKALLDYIEAHGRVVSYAKGQAIVAEGQLCRLMGVVKSGYFKFTSLTSGGDEVVTGFSFEGEVVFDYVRTFMQQQPSLSTIKAGCDCEVKQVSLAEAREYVLSRCPGFIEKASSVLLAEAYQRYINLNIKSPAERYAELIQRRDGVVDILTLAETASFLGISRRHLQRIREAYK